MRKYRIRPSGGPVYMHWDVQVHRWWGVWETIIWCYSLGIAKRTLMEFVDVESFVPDAPATPQPNKGDE